MNYEQAIEYFEKLRNTSASEIIFESFYWAFCTALGVLLMLFVLAFLALCIILVQSIIKKERVHIELYDDDYDDIEIGLNIRYVKSFFCAFTKYIFKKDADLIKIFGFAALGCFFIVFILALIQKAFNLPISKRDIINSPYYQTLNDTQKEYIKYRHFILNDEPDDSKVIIPLEQFKDTIKSLDKLKDK